jgi:hypothetical protein
MVVPEFDKTFAFEALLAHESTLLPAKDSVAGSFASSQRDSPEIVVGFRAVLFRTIVSVYTLDRV